MKILILGCGPAGLIAAHSAAMHGVEDIRILSKPRKSYMNGAQYLHAPIPGISKESFRISYQLSGDVEGYRDKVYGDPSVQVSPESLVGIHEAWDIREAYDELWKTYGDYVMPWEASSQSLNAELHNLKPDITISTVPAPLLCSEGHGFTSTSIWSTDRCLPALRDNTVLCNGSKDYAWYRASKIQGFENTEWPENRRPPFPSHRLWQVQKPLSTRCECFPEVIRMGRYGAWRKGVLSHEAWGDTLVAIDEFREGERNGPTTVS